MITPYALPLGDNQLFARYVSPKLLSLIYTPREGGERGQFLLSTLADVRRSAVRDGPDGVSGGLFGFSGIPDRVTCGR
jgi:hypothetical protein